MRRRMGMIVGTVGALWVLLGWSAFVPIDLELVGKLHEPQARPVDQLELLHLAQTDPAAAFELAFEEGDEFFEREFNALDGVGANVGLGRRFTRVPRADLDGPGEWANHVPPRATGPNAEACVTCHNKPVEDGAGNAALVNHRDPTHSADPGQFILRDAPHIFATGAPQRLAEEMTDDLHAIRRRAARLACFFGYASLRLSAKGVSFGRITAVRTHFFPCDVAFDSSRIDGVDADLVVKPFDWKGLFTTVRQFQRGAAHNELGIQPVEIAGDEADGDFDGVADESTIGDMTALAIYTAAQPRPTTKVELASLGLITLTPEEEQAIGRGELVFAEIGCAGCHQPVLKIDDPIFSEPSLNPSFREEVFPGGQVAVESGVDPNWPVFFDLTFDQPDNIITDPDGNVIFRLGAFETDSAGRAIVRFFGDLKRHDMGPGLAENIDSDGVPASVFLTEPLWGVGSTGPYMHDARSTTVTEAILEHGGEAEDSRDSFVALETESQRDLVAFLENLVLFKLEEEEE